MVIEPAVESDSLALKEIEVSGGQASLLSDPTDVSQDISPNQAAKQSKSLATTSRVHSQENCVLLDSEAMKKLQRTAVSRTLKPGTYHFRIQSGTFSYQSQVQAGEPVLMLWIYGGRVINKKTNVEVRATWATLNGYEETLVLEVLETAIISAFFFDTHLEDNAGKIVLSAVRI